MDIILVRHGKADMTVSEQEDARRSLTPDGRKKLHKTMPSLGLLVKNLAKAQIWTSPLDRAVQTGEILARLFGLPGTRTCDFIAEGDYAAFLAALSAEKASSIIVVVGHLPHLSDWSQQLCGCSLPFKKGSAAAIRIGSLEPMEADLLWFFQPLALGQLGESWFSNHLPGR
jgi:phosphohistidine phosphatase